MAGIDPRMARGLSACREICRLLANPPAHPLPPSPSPPPLSLELRKTSRRSTEWPRSLASPIDRTTQTCGPTILRPKHDS
jgi:hypothetical protein